MTDRVAQGDGCAHAVPEQEERWARLLVGRERDERLEIRHSAAEPIDHRTWALGATVTAVLDRVHRVTLSDEPSGDVRVAVTVLAGAVSDHDHRPGPGVGQPRLPEDSHATAAGQEAVAVVAHACPCAHGTTTASSCGESRATTYSAGSVSEAFSSTWVSRGGT